MTLKRITPQQVHPRHELNVITPPNDNGEYAIWSGIIASPIVIASGALSEITLTDAIVQVNDIFGRVIDREFPVKFHIVMQDEYMLFQDDGKGPE